MAITSLNTNDSGSTSRTVINDNFTDLDTTKADLASPTFTGTPTLPTGTIATTQSASDNSTKLATTAYVDNQVTAGATTAVTVVPKPNYFSTAAGTLTWNSNTTGYTAQMVIPVSITVNKISFNIDSTPTDGTIKIGIYSEDGQTKKIDVTSGTLSAVGLYTVAVSAVTLNAGIYYLVIIPVGTASVTAYGYSVGTAFDVLNPVTSEPKLYGTQTVTASTLPTTFTPSSITDTTTGAMPYIRLDN